MAKVLVTGATGFIAGHVIHQLVEAGHEVTGTARSASKANALNKTLSAYAGKPIRIDIRAADLSSDAGWTEACQGMDYVQHIASPIPTNLPKDHDELINPARDGAIRVLTAAKAAGVKRVVMTSSMAAIAYGWGDARPKLLTEEHWSNPDNLADNTAYTRSKTIAERAAWDYVNGEGKGLEQAALASAILADQADEVAGAVDGEVEVRAEAHEVQFLDNHAVSLNLEGPEYPGLHCACLVT